MKEAAGHSKGKEFNPSLRQTKPYCPSGAGELASLRSIGPQGNEVRLTAGLVGGSHVILRLWNRLMLHLLLFPIPVATMWMLIFYELSGVFFRGMRSSWCKLELGKVPIERRHELGTSDVRIGKNNHSLSYAIHSRAHEPSQHATCIKARMQGTSLVSLPPWLEQSPRHSSSSQPTCTDTMRTCAGIRAVRRPCRSLATFIRQAHNFFLSFVSRTVDSVRINWFFEIRSTLYWPPLRAYLISKGQLIRTAPQSLRYLSISVRPASPPSLLWGGPVGIRWRLHCLDTRPDGRSHELRDHQGSTCYQGWVPALLRLVFVLSLLWCSLHIRANPGFD